MSYIAKQSIKLLLAKEKADTVSGVADVVIKIPGAYPAKDRSIEGGMACFANQGAGDWVDIELRDDDNILGLGAGYVVDSFNDEDVTTDQKGWFLLGSGVLEIHPIVSDDPSDLVSGFYLHICGHKGDGSSDTLYVNLHWGKRIR